MVPMTSATVVERLARRTDIAIVFRFVSKTLGSEERAVLSMNAVASSHIRRDAPIHQPLQKLAVPIGGIGHQRLRLPALPCGETGEHILCRHSLLTHARCRRLHS